MLEARAVPAADRALEALPGLAVRRVVLRERLTGAPPDAVACIDLIVRRALGGRTTCRDAAVALASSLVELRRADPAHTLSALRDEATRGGQSVVAALLVDAPAHRALAPRGRLREVCVPERAPFRRWSLARERDFPPASLRRLRQSVRGEEWSAHSSPVYIGRLLREPWLEIGDVLRVAARRPTSAALAFELVCHDRWLQRLEVREAMVQNPFTPTGIVLALLPTIRRPLLAHLRDAGDAHPVVAAAAAELLALRD